ncbi:MAG: TolC family protein, partial [Polyangiaceae bacterium]
ARLDAMQRQSGDRAAAKAVDIRSEVRSARDRVLLTRRLVEHYRAVLIPLRERIVALSQQEFEAMLLGVYQLILAKQGEINTYREYIEAVRDYWLARSELERAAGGRLSRSVEADAKATAVPSPEGAVSPATTPHIHHH